MGNCSAAFLDISQAFDKVWHNGLLYKLKRHLPHNYYNILHSYLDNRYFYVKYLDEHTSLIPIESGVPQGSVLAPVLYLIFTADLPTTDQITTATYADDTAIMASHEDERVASELLQESLNKIQTWLETWRIRANERKSVHVTFTMKKKTCPQVELNSVQLPQADAVKYLGLHLERRLTWQKHIWTKRLQLETKLKKMYWLIGRNSKLSMDNKLLLYKTILKPIWTYACQLWGTASVSNTERIERFQSKTLRLITNAPWFVPNWIILQDLHLLSVKEDIQNFSRRYHERLHAHPNQLASNLLQVRAVKRLKKKTLPIELR